MSVITDQIRSYRAGTIDLATLIAKLSRRTYPAPARMQGAPENVFARAAWIDEQPSYTDGTWDEVLRARNYGLLTDDEYNQINAAFEQEHSVKGDSSGHPFHGNRYTGGLGEETTTETHGGVTTTTTSLSTDPGIRALHEYQRAGYDHMNERIRKSGAPTPEIKALDSLMQPLTEDRTLYRAIGEGGLANLVSRADSPVDFMPSRDLSEQELHDRLAALVGVTILDKGFTSTSGSKDVAGAKVNHGSVIVELSVPAGTPAIDITGRKLGDKDFDFEQEVLLGRGGKYQIDGVSEKKVGEDAYSTEFPVFVLHMSVAK